MALPRLIRMPSFSIQLFVESLMHLLFEGILGKSIIVEVANNLLFKQCGIGPKTNKSVNDHHMMVKKVSLTWLLVHPLAEAKDNAGNNVTCSCSGWQGINFIAAARLLPITHSVVRSALKEKNNFINHSQKEQKKFKLDLFELTIQTCHSIAARLMQKNITKEQTNETHEHIKCFLSLCCRHSQLTECLKPVNAPPMNTSTASSLDPTAMPKHGKKSRMKSMGKKEQQLPLPSIQTNHKMQRRRKEKRGRTHSLSEE